MQAKEWNKQTVDDIHDWAKKTLEIAEATQRRFDMDLNYEDLWLQLKLDMAVASETYSIEESFLRQKSRCIRLKGDRNSRIFYDSLKISKIVTISRLEENEN